MKLTPSEIEFLVSCVRKYFPSTSFELLLFGSYASGRATKSSDVDLAIIGAGPLSPSDWQMLEDELAESDYRKKVDLVDFHRVSKDFQDLIRRTGTPLDGG